MKNQVIEEFLREATIMRQFTHPNVLSMFGISVHNDKPCVIMPLMSNGDLRNYLRKNSSVSVIKNFYNQGFA